MDTGSGLPSFLRTMERRRTNGRKTGAGKPGLRPWIQRDLYIRETAEDKRNYVFKRGQAAHNTKLLTKAWDSIIMEIFGDKILVSDTQESQGFQKAPHRKTKT